MSSTARSSANWTISGASSDLDLERADQMGHGTDTPIHENLLGIARVIGYRDDQGLVKLPTVPFRPGAKVFLVGGAADRRGARA